MNRRCGQCAQAARDQATAERMTARLLDLLQLAEAREARQRDEIRHLEARLTRHAPKWEAETA